MPFYWEFVTNYSLSAQSQVHTGLDGGSLQPSQNKALTHSTNTCTTMSNLAGLWPIIVCAKGTQMQANLKKDVSSY